MTENIHTEGIAEDGLVEDCDIETYYRQCEAIAVADGYMRVQVDDGALNIETRIPFSALEQLGWKRSS